MNEAKWNQLYEKVHQQFREQIVLCRRAVLKTPALDRLETLRLIINCYSSGKRTQKLFKQMQEMVDEIDSL